LTALEICSTPESSFRLASSLNNNCFAMILFLLFFPGHSPAIKALKDFPVVNKPGFM
jgi:hypothetical protein